MEEEYADFQRIRRRIQDSDLTRLYFRVSYGEVAGDTFFGDEEDEVFVPYPNPKVTFLLGRNGAGKTTFLDGLKRLCQQRDPDRCFVSLICAADARMSNEDWNVYVKSLRQMEMGPLSPWFYDHVPPILTMLQNRTIGSKPRPLGGVFGELSGRDFLDLFKFNSADIPKWVGAGSGSVLQLLPEHYLESEIGGGPIDLSIPVSAAWIFLDACTESTLDLKHPTNDPGPDTYTDPDEWFAEPTKLELVRDAFQEFSRQVLVEVGVVKGSYRLRYLTPRPLAGALADLLRMRDSALIDDGEDTAILPAFPFDLVIDAAGPNGEEFIATPWVPAFPEISHSSVFKSGLFRLQQPIPDSDSTDDLHQAESDLIEYFVRPSVTEVTDDSIVAEFHGLERLSRDVVSVGELLRNLESGIDAMRLKVSYYSRESRNQDLSQDEQLRELLDSLKFVGLTGFHLPFGVRIEWKAPDDERWRSLDSASDGQKRLMTTLLRIERVRTIPHSVLLSDEFDARLHPTTARRLIRLIDLYMESIGAVGFISTHNASYASMATNPNLYAYRNHDGRFQLAIDPVESDVASLRDLLGTDELDLLGLRRLVVVVEGYHDLRVLQKMVEGEKDILQYVWIVQSEGIRNFGLLWDVLLNLLSVPILFVHDKRNPELEECVEKLRHVPKWDDPWEKSGLAKLASEVKARKKKSIRSRPVGDDEFSRMLLLMERVVSSGHQGRVYVHGLEKEDIVDYLEPTYFRNVTDWDVAHAAARSEGIDGAAFKDRHQVNQRFESALQSPTLTWSMDLQALYDHIRRLARLSGANKSHPSG